MSANVHAARLADSVRMSRRLREQLFTPPAVSLQLGTDITREQIRLCGPCLDDCCAACWGGGCLCACQDREAS